MNVRHRPIPVLDLFSGYGGFTLAFDWIRQNGVADTNVAVRSEGQRPERKSGGSIAGARPAFHTIGFSEIDEYVSAILAERWPGIPNLGAVQSITKDRLLAECGVLPRIVTGGFPCQPHSLAGSRSSVEDERDLWEECWRILRDVRPQFAIFENVAGLLTSASYSDAATGELESGLFLNRVLSDLAAIRYACQWHVVSAADAGAPHKRDRVWLLCIDELAYRHGIGRPLGQSRIHATEAGADAFGDVAEGGADGLAHASGVRRIWGTVSHGADAERIPVDARDGATRREAVGCSARDAADELADSDRAGGNEDHESGELRADRIVESSGYRGRTYPREDGEVEGIVWPSAFGCWPSRPGEPQYWWEPSRTVAYPARDRREGSTGDVQPADGGSLAGVSRESEQSGGTRIGEVESIVGGDADGIADGSHAVAVPVREEAEDEEDEWINLQTISAEQLDAIALEEEADTEEVNDRTNRVHRLRALGNGVVPAVAYIFARAVYDLILATESHNEEEE